MIRAIAPEVESKLVVEEINDPEHNAKSEAQYQRTKRNCDWLAAHWPEVLPQARGRHIAVAGQQAFIADTAEEAWALAKAAHSDDNGAILQYVFPHTHPRIYAHRG